jgi:hypothetical protein
MPTDATPFEQVFVVAFAAYATGELTVAPLAGLLTVTLAINDVVIIKNIKIMLLEVFIRKSPASGFLGARSRGTASSESVNKWTRPDANGTCPKDADQVKKTYCTAMTVIQGSL